MNLSIQKGVMSFQIIERWGSVYPFIDITNKRALLF